MLNGNILPFTIIVPMLRIFFARFRTFTHGPGYFIRAYTTLDVSVGLGFKTFVSIILLLVKTACTVYKENVMVHYYSRSGSKLMYYLIVFKMLDIPK